MGNSGVFDFEEVTNLPNGKHSKRKIILTTMNDFNHLQTETLKGQNPQGTNKTPTTCPINEKSRSKTFGYISHPNCVHNITYSLRINVAHLAGIIV